MFDHAGDFSVGLNVKIKCNLLLQKFLLVLQQQHFIK